MNGNNITTEIVRLFAMLPEMCATGVVDKVTHCSRGTRYFRLLVDDLTMLRCVWFKTHQRKSTVKLSDDMTVSIRGYVQFNFKHSTCEFIVLEVTEGGQHENHVHNHKATER